MTKEEKIKSVFESFGFDWNECSKYVTEFGVIVLPHPELKYILKGYENLIRDKDRFVSFGDEGLKIQPSELSGIYNNNGWIKIESSEDLPENGYYEVIKRLSGFASRATLDKEFGQKRQVLSYSHYQNIVELPKPIF